MTGKERTVKKNAEQILLWSGLFWDVAHRWSVISNKLPINAAQQPRRVNTAFTPRRELAISHIRVIFLLSLNCFVRKNMYSQAIYYLQKLFMAYLTPVYGNIFLNATIRIDQSHISTRWSKLAVKEPPGSLTEMKHGRLRKSGESDCRLLREFFCVSA
jgi:hypothetical protein